MTDSIEISVEIGLFNNNLWGYHLIIHSLSIQDFVERNGRRIVVTLPGGQKWQAALMPSPAYWFVLLTKNRQRDLNLPVGSKFFIFIEKDVSEYGFEMPEELQAVFDQEPAAFTFFKNLTPGKIRTLIYLVIQVKNSQSRLNRSLAIADHLTTSQGLLDFKKLNERIKYYNNKDKNFF